MKKKILALLALGLLILPGCGLYSTYPGNESSFNQDNASSSLNNTENNNTPDNGISYYNNKYKFGLTFPSAWQSFVTSYRTISWGSLGTNDSLDIGLTDQKDLFNISFMPKALWAKLEASEGPKPVYLGEKDGLVYAYSQGQYAANETMAQRAKEISEIIKTFKLK